jgi:hypothetical protein
MSDDRDILDEIHDLMAEEHQLAREHNAPGPDPSVSERLEAIDVEIDRLWDLLRQRRARRRAGEDEDAAHLRPGDIVEGYQQ